MKILRYFVLVALGALLGFGSASGLFAESAFAQGCTIFVKPDESIQAAIDNAPEGAVICLLEGEWQENLMITKGLTLRGKGAERTVIRSKAEDPVAMVDSSEAIEVAIVGLKVTGAHGSFFPSPGVLVRGNARTTIDGCTISGNDCGIWLLDSAQAMIEGCTVSGNRYGIDVWHSARATIEGNSIHGNSWFGIASGSTMEVHGQGNKMYDNGVDLSGNLPGTLRIPLVNPTEQQIVFPDPRYATLQHAVDALLPEGRLILRQGEYEAGVTVTKDLEIIAEEGTAAVIKARSASSSVLSLVEGAKLVARNLTVIANCDGFVLGGDAQATIEGCTVSGNGYGTGIWVRDSAQATIEGCTISGNEYGIWLLDSSQALTKDSVVSENWQGIWLEDTAQATIGKCTISDNRHDGVMLCDSAQVEITECAIFQNKEYGIALRQRPCLDTDLIFAGQIAGKNNAIPGPGEPDGNGKGAVCSEDLSFLMTQEGGELDRRK